MNYSCHNSGVCCSIFHKIPVDDKSLRILATADLSRVKTDNGEPMTIASAIWLDDPDKGMAILARRDDHSCVFFDRESRTCMLHGVCGYDSKPRVCRDFPIRFRRTPDGVYVGLSFVCPSVRGNKGQPLAEQEQNLSRALLDAFSVSEVTEPLLLTGHIAISWPAYLELEEHFRALLTDSRHPLGIRLIACNVLINFIDGFFRQVHGEHPTGNEARALPNGEMHEFLKVIAGNGYADVWRVAGKPIHATRIRRMFLGMITSFANTLFHKRGRISVIFEVTRQYVRHAIGLGGVKLNPLPRRVPHRQLSETRFPTEGPATELLVRYFAHCLFRKDIVNHREVARGLNLLLLDAALVEWYAAAEAAQHRRVLPEYDDWSEAISHVERLFGFHSKFYQFFAEHPMIDDIIESFMLRKNYAFILLR